MKFCNDKSIRGNETDGFAIENQRVTRYPARKYPRRLIEMEIAFPGERNKAPSAAGSRLSSPREENLAISPMERKRVRHAIRENQRFTYLFKYLGTGATLL